MRNLPRLHLFVHDFRTIYTRIHENIYHMVYTKYECFWNICLHLSCIIIIIPKTEIRFEC